jgi:hypothetical protein
MKLKHPLVMLAVALFAQCISQHAQADGGCGQNGNAPCPIEPIDITGQCGSECEPGYDALFEINFEDLLLEAARLDQAASNEEACDAGKTDLRLPKSAPATLVCQPNDVFEISVNGVCDNSPSNCAAAMHAAGIPPPYFATRSRYSGACLIGMGVIVKPAGAVGTTALLNAAFERLWTRGSYVAAGACAALTGPVATTVFAAIAVREVFSLCECSN